MWLMRRWCTGACLTRKIFFLRKSTLATVSLRLGGRRPAYGGLAPDKFGSSFGLEKPAAFRYTTSFALLLSYSIRTQGKKSQRIE